MKRKRTRKTGLCSTPPVGVNVPIWKEGNALLDWASLRRSAIWSGEDTPRGDGAPVLVIPGFLCADLHMRPLRIWLKRIGYRAYASGTGLHAGCIDQIGEALLRKVDRILRDTGRRPHLVGHSLGGMLARSVAARRPQEVASVVALGSPMWELRAHGLLLAAARLLSLVERLRGAEQDGCMTPGCACPTVSAADSFPDEMPFTAIYTRADGVVDWRSCRSGNPEGDVEVGGTHLGLMYNPDAYAAIAQHLARVGGERRRAA